MVKDAPGFVAAARSGIQRRRERGIPEPTPEYGIEEDGRRRYLDLMLAMQKEIAEREANGNPVITAYRRYDG